MSRNTTMIPKRISSIRFGLMDPTEIRKMSAVEVKTADLFGLRLSIAYVSATLSLV